MKRKKNSILLYVALFVGLTAVYLALGLASSCVSDKAVERHVRQTLTQCDLESDFWFAFLYKPNYYMDNYTDALIVNQAWCLGGQWGEAQNMDLWQRVMMVPHQRCNGAEGIEDCCKSLRSLADGDTEMHTRLYPRYWHGSTFLMRMLLAIDDYQVLRAAFHILSSLLLLWTVLALAKKAGVWTAVIYALSLILVDVFMMQFSIQFMPVLILTLTGSLWVIYKSPTASQMGIICFVIGSLTAYFDLLTAPLLTWGIPVLVWIVISKRINYNVSLLTPFTWFVGYAATWASKWLLATLTTPMNVFADAQAQATLRAATEDYSRWGAVAHNFNLVPWLYVTIAAGVVLLIVLRNFDGKEWRRTLLCVAVALSPIAWYLALANHSYVHYWFTYRSIAISIMGLLMAVRCLAKTGR